MNKMERDLVSILQEMKEKYSVVMLKAEFETEASRMNELMRLKEIANYGGVGLIIKIGGPEAVSNLYEAKHLGADVIVAPMVETPYAMQKFLEAAKLHILEDEFERIELGVNIETKTAHSNLKEILSDKHISLLKNVVVGRVDMSGSLSMPRDRINSDEMYDICEGVFSVAKAKGLRCCMGGGISTDSVDFIKKLAGRGLLDRYETRKVVFENSHAAKDEIYKGILKAVEFELKWLTLKKEYYGKIYREDDLRIQMLTKRMDSERVRDDR